ncbi:MAG: tyrosine-protein phosphatase [Clostridia bacterium]|nr:tyrosine-protein phosphatase [Clostridia bacterium]
MLKYETQRIILDGVQNARQLGGYIGADGKRIKNNTILRTGMLFSASEDARRELSERYKVSDIIDLRADNETKTMPEPEINGARYHHLSVLTDLPVTEEDFKLYKNLLQCDDVVYKYKTIYEQNIPLNMERNYRSMVFDDDGKKGYRIFFDIVLNKPEDASVLFHCTQGKDRTGMGAILLLSSLGVDRETVVSDYLLTNDAYGDLLNKIHSELEAANVGKEILDYAMMIESVNEGLITPVLDIMDNEYGSVQGYLKSELGLADADFKRLNELYLEG